MSKERKKSQLMKIDDLLNRDTHNYFLYINYDNEAFMNTGIQESGSTPPFASTTTGPGGKKIKGKIGIKQDIINSFAFLGYKSGFFASANPAYPIDLIGKVIDALTTPGCAFLHIFSSCMRGWRHPENETHAISKLATESGYFPLFSIRVKNGQPEYSLNKKIDTDKEKIIEFVSKMGKYRHLFRPEKLDDRLDMIYESVLRRNENVLNLVEQFGGEAEMEIYSGKLKELPNQDHIAGGHGLCLGCGEGQIINQVATAAQMVAGKNVVYTNATSCMEISTSKDYLGSWKVPWVHHLFETSATIADSIATAYRILKSKGKYKGEIPYIIALAGDGGTFDIGFQFLKSALVRAGTWGIQNDLLAEK
jgi:pyruvate/2-oxoacid:ferredoxin oxidoreductase beta subunit